MRKVLLAHLPVHLQGGQDARRSTRREALPVNARRNRRPREFPWLPIRMQSTCGSCATFTGSSAGLPTRISPSMRSGATPCSRKVARALHSACSAALCCS